MDSDLHHGQIQHRVRVGVRVRALQAWRQLGPSDGQEDLACPPPWSKSPSQELTLMETPRLVCNYTVLDCDCTGIA